MKDLRYCVHLESNSIMYLQQREMFRARDAEENETHFILHTILP
jgi:hypothetical protein